MATDLLATQNLHFTLLCKTIKVEPKPEKASRPCHVSQKFENPCLQHSVQASGAGEDARKKPKAGKSITNLLRD